MKESQPQAILFDADGVTIIPKEPFSVQYATKSGVDLQTLTTFFDDQFNETMLGKRDLKELLEQRRDLWKWSGPVEELLQRWFEAENHRDEELVRLIGQLRQSGIKCYLATNQEKYRTQYIREVMFPGVFDRIFSSAEIGVKKPDQKYYQFIINTLNADKVLTATSNIAYFDDQSSNIKSAEQLGIKAYLYSGVEQIKNMFQN